MEPSSFWSSEAEEGAISGTTEIKEGCENASGAKFVKLGNANGNSLSFENINIDQAGTYQLAIDYFYVGSSSLDILVNDTLKGNFSFETAVWCYQGAASIFKINIDLNDGANKIEFQVAGGQSAPFLDKIQVSDPNKVQLTVSASSTSLVPGQSTELSISSSFAVSEDTEVDITVNGIHEQDFSLTPAKITIPSGSQKAVAVFKAIDNGTSENQTASISISTTNENAVVGEPGTIEIDIINQSINYYLFSLEIAFKNQQY